MLANYHTHTPRCNHATGSEREYIEKAIQEGVKVLGFSDHSPCLFDGDYYSHFRMRPELFEGYVNTIRSLAEEYAGQITLLVGVELEYYPRYFARTTRFLADGDCDYLILGQHFVGNEEKGSQKNSDKEVLDRYVAQVIEGIESGMYTYIAHPDMCGYMDDRSYREKCYLKLCEAAKRLNVPLEFNLLGLSENRWYPTEDFFKVAASVGNEIVLGCDAHSPNRIADSRELKAANAFLARCGITPTELSPENVLAKKKNIG